MSAAAVRTTLDLVLGYAARGWPVLPIYGLRNGHCTCRAGKNCKQSPGKHPITSHGSKDATLDVELVRAWFAKYPGCNWAIATGHALPDGGVLVVVDVDPRNGGDDSLTTLETTHGALPTTVTAISGGNGAHYLFRAPSAMSGFDLAEGIEFKAAGGYVLVHPSAHLSGRRYEWDAARHPDDTPLAALPAWVADRPSRPRPVTSGTDAASTLLGEAFRLAGLLGGVLPEGRRMVRCPWAHEHSDARGSGSDSSTVLLPPTHDSQFGGFKCLHSHCQTRGWRDVLAALPPDAVTAARAAFRPKPVPPPAPSSSAAVAGSDTWRSKLLYRQAKSGAVLEKASENVRVILQHDPRWAGRVRWDQFAEVVRVTEPPWEGDDAPTFAGGEWTDSDDARLQMWLMRQPEYALDIGVASIAQAVNVVAHANAYHEVRDYLGALVWDGEQRVGDFFATYFGAESTEYTRAVGQRWLISAVARIFEPGCQADSMPVLEGVQGAGKSTGLATLVGKRWFSDSHVAIGTPDGYAALRGKWVIELAELDAMRGRAVTAVRAFISASVDHYRDSYGRRHQTHARQCVFAGSTNETEYLVDVTGNRRFWPVACGTVNRDAIQRDRDQLWAEVVALYRAGTPWDLDTPDLRALATAEQSERVASDLWDDLVSEWLRAYDRGQGVRLLDILVDKLKVEPARVTRVEQLRLASILRRMGYAPRVTRVKDAPRCKMWFRDR